MSKQVNRTASLKSKNSEQERGHLRLWSEILVFLISGGDSQGLIKFDTNFARQVFNTTKSLASNSAFPKG